MSVTPDKLYEIESMFAAQHNLNPMGLAALRQARLALPVPAGADAADRLALWVVAPVLAGFTRWVADYAARSPEAKLLGVMREGRLLVQLLAPLLHQAPQEIWLNRKLSMVAAFGAGDDEALLNWLVRTRLQPLGRRAAVAFLTGTADEQPDVPLDLPAAQALLAGWQQNGTLPAIRARAHRLGDRLLAHWQQYVKDDAPVLLVDFASVGNIQRSLRTVLVARGLPDNTVGLNFCMTAGTRWARQAGCALEGYLTQDGQPEWLAAAYARTPELIEIFAAAPLGSLEDYGSDGTPQYGTSFLSAVQQQRLMQWQKSLLMAAAHYQQRLGAALVGDCGRILWGRLLLAPEAAEAAALGDWPLDAGLDGTAQRCLAPRLIVPEPWSKLQCAWPAGSLARRQEFG